MKNKDNNKHPLRQYLDLSGLTYRQAAKKTGLTHQTIWLHATGQKPIGGKSAVVYHNVFGISLDKLLNFEERGK